MNVGAASYGERVTSSELQLSTSPRMTWVWAADDHQADQLRAALKSAHCTVHPAVGRNAESRIVDLDIGVVAGEGIEALAAAGYTFRWHEQQHELNRSPDFGGIPIAG
ncbi:MAG: hypothetical protein ABIR17_12955 [Pseudolysinimonas sp.]|uniref:hypothetical protein n=1 Tax=Pseudolysinimonas sp. TaxID=2680009 RepID=UPI003263DCAB